MINYEILKMNIELCPYNKLKDLLSKILMGNIQHRRELLEECGREDRERKIGVVSVEVRK